MPTQGDKMAATAARERTRARPLKTLNRERHRLTGESRQNRPHRLGGSPRVETAVNHRRPIVASERGAAKNKRRAARE